MVKESMVYTVYTRTASLSDYFFDSFVNFHPSYYLISLVAGPRMSLEKSRLFVFVIII